MGNFYTNVTVRGLDQACIAAAVETLGYRVFVSPTISGLTVICEEQSDTQDEAAWHLVAKQLSEKLGCPALAVMNHDDDILAYALYRNGALLDDYSSWPDYWDESDEPAAPRGGNAATLCETFGMPGNASEVERILRTTADSEEFVFASERQAALLKALDCPEIPYQQGFTYITEDGAPAGWRTVSGARVNGKIAAPTASISAITPFPKSKLVEASLAPIFKKDGFKKKKLSWYREFDETVVMMHVRGLFGSSTDFYMEATVIFKAVCGVLNVEKLGFYDGHVRFRLELLVDDVGAFRRLLYFNEKDSDEKANEKLSQLSELIRSVVMRWLLNLGTVSGVREMLKHIDLLNQKSERSCAQIFPEGRQVLENPRNPS